MATAVNLPDVSRRCLRYCGFAGAGASAIVVLLAGLAAAQAPAEPPKPASDPPAAPSPAAPSAAENPGLVDVFGNWMQQGVTSMSTGFDAMVGAAKGAADAASNVAKGAAGVARDATDVAVDGVTKLSVSGIAGGREQCAVAGNGAPDCRVAVAALCRASGFSTGTSVDVESTQNCPEAPGASSGEPPYRVSSRARPDGVCSTNHFVTRALCK
jgi:hypothetical protein